MKSIEEYKLTYALHETVVAETEEEKIIYSLIDEFANDKNSSKFREDITKLVVGKQLSNSKLGYDDDIEAIEVKPINFTGTAKLLDGKGNFSDFTWARHDKYINDNVIMLMSGFCHGKLMFVVEFPYSSIQEKIQEVLMKKLPCGDQTGIYVRNVQFNYKHWEQSKFTIKYINPNIHKFKYIFVKNFYSLLLKNNNIVNEFLQWGNDD